MKIFSRICLLFLVISSLSFAANAQAPISEEKRKLISELAIIMKMDKESVAHTMDTLLKEMESSYTPSFREAVDQADGLSPEEKERLKATAIERYQSFSRRFRERLPQVVDYGKFVEETIYPLLDKFYTEQELSDMISFYRTPTGQKLVDTWPQLYAESIRMAQEKLLPQIAPLVKQLIEEDRKAIEGKAGQPKPSPPPPAKSNR